MSLDSEFGFLSSLDGYDNLLKTENRNSTKKPPDKRIKNESVHP